jgi:hypothetical protein
VRQDASGTHRPCHVRGKVVTLRDKTGVNYKIRWTHTVYCQSPIDAWPSARNDSLYTGSSRHHMNNMDFWSIALGFVSAAPVGVLAIWVVRRQAYNRIPKWNGWKDSPKPH